MFLILAYAPGQSTDPGRRPSNEPAANSDPELPAEAGPRAKRNPLSRNPAAVETGLGLYLERCAVCHGQDARGGMAANLTRSRVVARGSDAAFFRILREGIPGTEMFAQKELSDEQLWQIIAYLHGLTRPGEQPPLPGDIESGERVFRNAGCSQCHMVAGDGGVLGPDLSSIGGQKTAEEIRVAVLDPHAKLAEGFRPAIVTTKGGEQFSGVLKNEDTFSLQILTKGGEFVLFTRDEIREVAKPQRSWMPDDFSRRLTSDELRNLMAYLDRQRMPFVTVERGFQNY